MVECVITFKEDIAATPKAVPRFHYDVSRLKDRRLYDRIMQYTGDHELAENVEAWAEFASIGEAYETDELTVEITD